MNRTPGFDDRLANELARLESYNKHLYRPNTYLHKWWARRCGTTFRMILKNLVEEPERRGFYRGGGLEGVTILDPMMGGGTTLHEAIRMGANVVGFDVDPIPVLQAKASLSDTPLSLLESSFSVFFDDLTNSLASHFVAECPSCSRPSNVRYTLYGQLRACGCDKVIMVDSLLLREESDGGRIEICENCHSVKPGSDACLCRQDGEMPLIVTKEKRQCHRCGEPYKELVEMPFFARYSPLVTVSDCDEHGIAFASTSELDRRIIDKANRRRRDIHFDSNLEVADGPKSADLLRKKIPSYADLFSSRQLLYLRRAIDLVKEHEPPVRLFLSLLLSTSLEFNSMLCGYKGAKRRRAGAIRHTFSHHAYSFPFTALEANPVYPHRSSGTLAKLFHDRVRRAREWADLPRERILASENHTFIPIKGEVDKGVEAHDLVELGTDQRRFYVQQGSASSMPLHDDSVDFVVTDPPYYDSVQYTDLSAFFRVWLKQMITEEDATGIDWDYEQGTSAVALQGGGFGNDDGRRFTEAMSQIVLESLRVLRPEKGRLVFTFHHWDPRAWSSITLALKRAHCELLEAYIVHAENPMSVHIANLRALTDDAVLVLAPAQAGWRTSWESPADIAQESSAQFCRDCAALLGWMLMTEISEDEIRLLWRQKLRNR